LNSAVRAPPICRKPVGDGAKRVTTGAGMAAEISGLVGPCNGWGGRCHGKTALRAANGPLALETALTAPI
jgi:hypothetical protein